MNIYDQLKQLWARVTGLEKSNASLAPLIPKIPKDYSTTETDTGVKWVDGKEIYRIAIYDTLPSESGSKVVGTIPADTVLYFTTTIIAAGTRFCRNDFTNTRIGSDGNIVVSYYAQSSGEYAVIIVYYTKQGQGRSPETKATKAAKKKATK